MKRQLIEDLKVAESAWRNHEMGGHRFCRNCQEADDEAAADIRDTIRLLKAGTWDRDVVDAAIHYTRHIREKRRAVA